MNQAVFSSCEPVVLDKNGCCCEQSYYRSDKDKLCEKLFGRIPPGLDSETQLPDIETWREGVHMEGELEHDKHFKGPYTFIIEEDEESDPKKSDVIFYKGRFYVIGDVQTVVEPYLEIEPEMIWVYPDWAVDNDVYSNTRWNVK